MLILEDEKILRLSSKFKYPEQYEDYERRMIKLTKNETENTPILGPSKCT